MRNLLALLPLLLAPSLAFTDAPAPADVLTDDENLTMCAEALPRQLDCKKKFCAAMVKIRAKGASKADRKTMKAKCKEEIAVDGTGDLAARKARCAAWAKDRPKMSVLRADGRAMDACWTKANCKDRIKCWAPKMAKMMGAAAPKKK